MIPLPVIVPSSKFWSSAMMKRFVPVLVLLSLLAAPAALLSQDSSSEPQDSGVQEEVAVTLLQVDAVVMNKKGKTVPDLTKDDFELRIGDQVLEIDTMDVFCPIGAEADPLPIKGKKAPEIIGPGVKRKIVMAFDYYFLEHTVRAPMLEAAASMIDAFKPDEEEVMIVALAWGVRVEQRFTSDKRQLLATLQRMEHDKTLWAFEYTMGTTGKEYMSDLMTLMDVLEGHAGAKAVVMFSQAKSVRSSLSDLWYNDVAMHAANSRSAFYPANPDLLLASGHGSDTLTRLANQSGGRMPYFTNDLSVPYRWAQRDLSCRYTLGAYLDDEQGKKRNNIHLTVTKPDTQLRHPEMIKFFTDAELKEMRQQAAFVDPEPFEHPLVRAFAFPAYPSSDTKWETLLSVHFPMPVADGPADVNVQAMMKRNGAKVGKKYKNQFRVDPPEGGGDTRSVTIVGDAQLKDGPHALNIVLSRPEGEEIVSAEAKFNVPQVLTDLLILRGPLLARVVPGGMLVQADPKNQRDDTRLERLIGTDSTFEPLLVHEIKASEELLTYWNACVQGTVRLTGDAVINRRFMTEDGELAHELDPIPLDLKSQAKKLSCQDELEKLPANTLAPGEYEYDITITYTNGDLISASRVPLLVR
jgi:VWFA-related protein